VIARGYQADVEVWLAPHHVSRPAPAPLETVLAEWRACRVDKTNINPWTAAPSVDVRRGEQALECLKQRGYPVESAR